MGKKKDKDKDNKDRPRRKDLAREVERLEAENEELRARLEKIAELVAGASTPKKDETPTTQTPILLDASAT